RKFLNCFTCKPISQSNLAARSRSTATSEPDCCATESVWQRKTTSKTIPGSHTNVLNLLNLLFIQEKSPRHRIAPEIFPLVRGGQRQRQRLRHTRNINAWHGKQNRRRDCRVDDQIY